MKKYLFAIASISILLTACNKHDEIAFVDEKVADNNSFIIKAYIDDEVTKTTYVWNSGTSKYDFSWLNGDRIQVQVKHKTTANTYDAITGTTSSTEAQAVFTTVDTYTSDTWEVADYAFYPCQYVSGVTTDTWPDPKFSKNLYHGTYQTDLLYGKGPITELTSSEAESATTPTVRLFGTITEDANYPMRHIPMIGKKDGDGNFAFKAATGVLKVTLANLPTTATQIRLNSNAYDLNGYFVFDESCEIKESYATAGYPLKYMNISIDKGAEDTNNDGVLDAPRSFYFPVPTGTITAGDLQVTVTDGTNTIYSVTSKQDIPITRAVVTELPTITLYAATITVGGTASAITATIGFAGATDNVKVVLAESTSAGEVLIDADDTAVQSLVAAGTTTALSANNISGSKKCYIVVRTYNSSNINKWTYSIPVYFLSADDEQLLGTYTHATNAGCKAGGTADIPGTSKFTIVVSDNPTAGNMMVSNFDDMNCTNKVPGIYNSGTVAWNNYNEPFDKGTPVKRFARSSQMDTKLNFVFTKGTPNTFYADFNFGYVQGTPGAWAWQYYYHAGSEHVYTQQP